jgi:RNA polymerase sigma-70 factor, ECF subfamily
VVVNGGKERGTNLAKNAMIALVTRQPSQETATLPALDAAAEAVLITRCRRQERGAQEELYHRFRRQVAGNLFRALGDRQDLEDLVQEVFVIAFRGLEKFRGEARLSTWIYRICINVSLGRIRTKRRRPAAIGVVDLEATAAAQSGSTSLAQAPETPDRAAERSDAKRVVYEALEQLPAKKRMVLYLHEIEGLDLKEIAYLVDSNAVTVRTRLFYARKEFYRILTAGTAPDGAAPAVGPATADAPNQVNRATHATNEVTNEVTNDATNEATNEGPR